MGLFVFDLRGSLGHFRRPDTLATHATYPFITRTALHGLAGAVLGLEQLPESPWCGVQLLGPVATVSQELSLLGKGWTGGGPNFSRPTAIEFLVQPHYRVYYAGCLCTELEDAISNRRSHYHTYLGSAFCLTVPEPVASFSAEEIRELSVEPGQVIESLTVVPSFAVERLELTDGCQYARVGGVVYEHLGDRRFEGSVSAIYDVEGRPVRFVAARAARDDKRVRFCHLPDGKVVTLW